MRLLLFGAKLLTPEFLAEVAPLKLHSLFQEILVPKQSRHRWKHKKTVRK